MLKLESLQFFIPTARGRNFGMEKNVINAPSGGVFPIYYNITWGGGGAAETPILYYVIYEEPLRGLLLPLLEQVYPYII